MDPLIRYNLSTWLLKGIAFAKSSLAHAERNRVAPKASRTSKEGDFRLGVRKANSGTHGPLDASGMIEEYKSQLPMIASFLDVSRKHSSVHHVMRAVRGSYPSTKGSAKQIYSYQQKNQFTSKGKSPKLNEATNAGLELYTSVSGQGIGSIKRDSKGLAEPPVHETSGIKKPYGAAKFIKRQQEPIGVGAKFAFAQSPHATRILSYQFHKINELAQGNRKRDLKLNHLVDIGWKQTGVNGVTSPRATSNPLSPATSSGRNYRMTYAPSRISKTQSLKEMARNMVSWGNIGAGDDSDESELASAGVVAVNSKGMGASESTAIEGDVFLDGSLVGRWIERTLTRSAARQPIGGTAFDPTRSRLPVGTMVGL